MSVSEKSSEKIGRPPVTFDEVLDVSGEPGMSRRQKQNRYYAGRAIVKLAGRYGPEAEETAWLYRGHRARQTILSELGRLEGDEGAFWSAAAWVLENKPGTATAARVLRNYRTGKPPRRANASALAWELSRALDGYGRRHPDLTGAQVVEALRTLLEAEEGAL